MSRTINEIHTNNKRIIDFYNNNNYDFEQMNLLFIDILEKLMLNMDTSLNNNIATTLLEKINNIEKNVNKSQSDISNIILNQMTEYRKEYMNDIKLLLSSNNNDGLLPLIKETNINLLDKTTLLLNDLLPKNQTELSKSVFSQLSQFQISITNETNKLTSSALDKNTIDTFFNTLTSSFTNIISASESRVETRLNESDRKINDIKEITNSNKSSQQQLQSNISEILKKFENGSTKGNMSENILYNILLSLFPCATIDHVGNELKETGDIVLIRNNKPKILIENKDHESKNVTKQEVDKFIRDCEIQKCSGVMFAQHRGICNKEHFELQIHNGIVLLYVHEVKFDKNIIKTAIEIVEQFKMKFDESVATNNNGGHTIEQSIMEEINKEVVIYISQRNSMNKLLKDFSDKMNQSINDLKIPSLEKFLSNKFAKSTIQSESICKYCETHIPKSVKQHMRHCLAKKAYDLQHPGSRDNDEIDNDEEPDNTVQINTPVVIKPVFKTSKKK
jgi:hypothetical protein